MSDGNSRYIKLPTSPEYDEQCNSLKESPWEIRYTLRDARERFQHNGYNTEPSNTTPENAIGLVASELHIIEKLWQADSAPAAWPRLLESNFSQPALERLVLSAQKLDAERAAWACRDSLPDDPEYLRHVMTSDWKVRHSNILPLESTHSNVFRAFHTLGLKSDGSKTFHGGSSLQSQ